MPTNSNTVFLVSAYGDPVILRIQGKATYLNCAPVGHFFDKMIAEGARNFVVDLHDCQGMDSTFLGILASAGLELREQDPPGELVLVRLSQRNRELVKNLGLHNIMVIDEGRNLPDVSGSEHPLLKEENSRRKGETANSKMVLKAHKALGEVDESNKKKFQDVISFLQRKVEES